MEPAWKQPVSAVWFPLKKAASTHLSLPLHSPGEAGPRSSASLPRKHQVNLHLSPQSRSPARCTCQKCDSASNWKRRKERGSSPGNTLASRPRNGGNRRIRGHRRETCSSETANKNPHTAWEWHQQKPFQKQALPPSVWSGYEWDAATGARTEVQLM